MNYLTTEVSTSRQKKFGMVVFVDTPGLVDGDMKYPFDVDDTIVWLGRYAGWYGVWLGYESNVQVCVIA